LKRETDPTAVSEWKQWNAKWHAARADHRTACALDEGEGGHQPISELKKRIEALRFEAEDQTRKGQLDRAAQIQYGELPKLEAELKKLNAVQDGNSAWRGCSRGSGRGRHRQIVSKWTGFPWHECSKAK